MRNLGVCLPKWSYFIVVLTVLALAPIRTRGDITVTSVEGPTFPTGSPFSDDPYDSTSTSPLAPFNGQSVTFVGYEQAGASAVTSGDAYLRYEYEISSPTPFTLGGFDVTEAGDFRADANLELLNSTAGIIKFDDLDDNTVNQLTTFDFTFPGVEGSTFYLEQFDRSTDWTYVQNVTTVLPEPTSLGLLSLGGFGLLRRRRSV